MLVLCADPFESQFGHRLVQLQLCDAALQDEIEVVGLVLTS
jgi:hypothetical protein